MAVRSRRFFGPTTLGATTAILYTVPAERTAVVRTLTLVNRSAGAVLAVITLNGGASSEGLAYVSLPTQTSTVLTADLVLNPGDVLRGFATAAGAVAVAAFGSLLDGAPE